MTQIVVALALAAIGAGARELRAQCPDGSPPPCRTQTVAAATPRRVNPPLDEHTWIVVPFDNLAKNTEVEWLRGASVNLLYLDMSRWSDIRVIDDERVADLVREVPEANNAANLSLNAGLAVARRAGAGRLVMGDLLRVGNRTAVTAKVFDVKSGQRVRSVREETSVADSVMSIFPKLAQRLLNLAPPQGANMGSLGTTRVDAYQEYIAGVEALNRFELAEARKHLQQALVLDSAFALAHYKMTMVIGWDGSGDRSQAMHAEAAARLAAGLPARERALISASNASTHGDWTKACATHAALVRADSNDVEALYGLGDCKYHDPIVDAIGGDTSRMRFRADWNQSIRSFQRVLALDPTYHLAYQHIIDAYTAERRPTACYVAEQGGKCALYSAFLIRDGDSLMMSPAALPADSIKLRVQAERYVQTRSRRRNLQLAQATAAAWVAAAPDEHRARYALGHVLLLQGRLDAASEELARARSVSVLDEIRRLLDRMEIAYKQGRGTEANRLYDSVRTGNMPLPAPNPLQFGNAIAGYGPAFGRLAEFDSLVAPQLRSASPELRQYQHYALRGGLTGAPHDSLGIAEKALFDQIAAARGANAATRNIASSLSFSILAPRASWPAVDTTIRERKTRAGIALATGDAAGLRRAALALDSAMTSTYETAGSDSGFAVVAADAYLTLRDSAAALRVLRFALDSLLPTTSLFPQQNTGGNSVYYVPRMMLLRADLAAAAGQKDEARVWYKRFIDTWSSAVPEFQPIVDRARRAYAALGGT